MNVGAVNGSGIVQQPFPVPAPPPVPTPTAIPATTSVAESPRGMGDHRSSDRPPSESVTAAAKAANKATTERTHKALTKKPEPAAKLPPLKGLSVEDFRLILGTPPVTKQPGAPTLKTGVHDAGAQDFGTQDFGTQSFGTQSFGTQSFGTQDFGIPNIGNQDAGALNLGGQTAGQQSFTPHGATFDLRA